MLVKIAQELARSVNTLTMKEIKMSRDSKVDINNLMTRINNLYEQAYDEGRREILSSIRLALQKKDAEGDHLAVAVILWLLDEAVGKY